MSTPEWEIVAYATDSNYCIDRAVEPHVLATCGTEAEASELRYTITRQRAISDMSSAQWRGSWIDYRRVGDWMPWSTVEMYGDRVGA